MKIKIVRVKKRLHRVNLSDINKSVPNIRRNKSIKPCYNQLLYCLQVSMYGIHKPPKLGRSFPKHVLTNENEALAST